MFDLLAYGGNPTLWIAVIVIVVLLFGANRIPELFRGLGSGMKEFKKGLSDENEDENTTGDPPGATKV